MTDWAGGHKGGKRPTIMTYDKKPDGCCKWNSQRHRMDYTKLTNSETHFLGRKFKEYQED